MAGGAATFRQSCVFGVFVGNPAFAPVLSSLRSSSATEDGRSNTAEGGKATARQVVKNIFVKVEVSAFSLGFQQNLAVVATSNPSPFPAKMPGCLTHKHRLWPHKLEKVGRGTPCPPFPLSGHILKYLMPRAMRPPSTFNLHPTAALFPPRLRPRAPRQPMPTLTIPLKTLWLLKQGKYRSIPLFWFIFHITLYRI